MVLPKPLNYAGGHLDGFWVTWVLIARHWAQCCDVMRNACWLTRAMLRAGRTSSVNKPEQETGHEYHDNQVTCRCTQAASPVFCCAMRALPCQLPLFRAQLAPDACCSPCNVWLQAFWPCRQGVSVHAMAHSIWPRLPLYHGRPCAV